MAQQPNILTPREPLSDPILDSRGQPTGKSTVTRPWYRFFDSLNGLAGKLLNPVVIADNSIITPGDINSGSTVTLADSPARTLLGNSQNIPAQPTPQVVDTSLSFENGSLGAASLPPLTLSGNASTEVAKPGPIFLAPSLFFTGNTLNALGSSTAEDQTWVATIRDTRGQVDTAEQRISMLELDFGSIRDMRGPVASLSRRVDDVFTMSMLANGGGQFSIVVSASPYLTGGVVSNGGTITAATIGATGLIGNSATTAAVPGSIAVGAGLTLTGGTLTAGWQATAVTAIGTIFTNSSGTLHLSTIAGGSLLGNATFGLAEPGPVGIGAGLDTAAGNIIANYQAGTLTTFGTGVTLTSGTLTATGSGGTVTQIVAGSNLTGGTITGSGTIALQNSPTITITGTAAPMVLNANTAFPAGPSGTLVQLVGPDATQSRLVFDAFGATPAIVGRRAQGTEASPTAVVSGSVLFSMQGFGYGTTYVANPRARIDFTAAETWTGAAQGAMVDFQSTPTGGTLTAVAMRLQPDGALTIGTTTEVGTSKLQVVGKALIDQINLGTVTTGPIILPGTGVPTITAASGSMFIRTDGSAGARIYINQNGTSSWAAIASV